MEEFITKAVGQVSPEIPAHWDHQACIRALSVLFSPGPQVRHTLGATLSSMIPEPHPSVIPHTVIYQVKRLLDLDFIPQTQSRSDHKTRKELPGSFVASDPHPVLFGNGLIQDRSTRQIFSEQGQVMLLQFSFDSKKFWV